MNPVLLADALIATAVVVLSLVLRPWRAVGPAGPPWPWLAWWAGMPLMWGADELAGVPLLQPLSGACLLVLMAGWPLAMLAMVGTAAVTMVVAGLPWAEALGRLVWMGMLPGTLALLIGLGTRRWLPRHLFVFVLGRAFLGSTLALVLCGGLALWLRGTPYGLMPEDVMLGRSLNAVGDALITGGFATVFIVLRPQWLATWSDRLYLDPPELRPPARGR